MRSASMPSTYSWAPASAVLSYKCVECVVCWYLLVVIGSVIFGPFVDGQSLSRVHVSVLASHLLSKTSLVMATQTLRYGTKTTSSTSLCCRPCPTLRSSGLLHPRRRHRDALSAHTHLSKGMANNTNSAKQCETVLCVVLHSALHCLSLCFAWFRNV